jgi:exodeoxyribonuclease V alpha subunit
MATLDADDAAPLLETWDTMENDNPQDPEVPNWANDAKFQEFSLFLSKFGVHAQLAETIYQHYGSSAMQVVQTDPYRLVWEVAGIGFKTADTISRGLGMLPNTPSRLDAGVMYALWQMISDGHVYVPLPCLVGRASQLLNIDEPVLRPTLGRLEQNGHIRPDALPCKSTVAIYPTSLYQAEIGVVAALRCMLGSSESRLCGCGSCLDSDASDGLSTEQHQAVSLALASKVSILTGQPGTGKTTALRALIKTLEACERRYALACPTGRAAKRLSEVTGRQAQTIHRLLGYSPELGFTFNAHQRLDVDIVIVDEASMVDLPLMYRLIQAIQPATHLLLVGDVDQLPSVGPGNVLGDLIACEQIPALRLTTIFRQAAESLIISNARRINQGQMPLFATLDQNRNSDFFLFDKSKPESVAEWVVDIVQNRIPRRFGFDPLEDIQVLSPMRRGRAGVDELNRQLQEALNPPKPSKPELRIGKRILRVGDRVMQIRNDYPKGVVNGDVGWIVDLDPKQRAVTVAFDQGQHIVPFTWRETNDIRHAFAATIHKAQGSEFSVVVIPVLLQQRRMLKRNLLYTAITRARKLCILVGTRQAICFAVENTNQAKRWSGLTARLRD